MALDWIEAHCVIPDGFRKGRPFLLYEYQVEFLGLALRGRALRRHARAEPGAAVSRRDDPYLEVYWRLAEEYPEVWDDDRALAWYLRLLKGAEAAWPTHPDTPAGIPARTWDLLVSGQDALVIPEAGGRRYRVRGLDKKRDARSTAASKAARSRWRNAGRNADGIADGNAEAMPQKQSRAEHLHQGDSGATPLDQRARGLMAGVTPS